MPTQHKQFIAVLTMLTMGIGGFFVGPVFGQDTIEPVASDGTVKRAENFSDDTFIPTVEESTPLYGDTDMVKRDGAKTETEKIETIENKFQDYQKGIMQRWENDEAQKRAELLEKQQELDAKVEEFTELSESIEDYQAELTPLRMQIQTLSGQITYLEDRMFETQEKISSVEVQIQSLRIEVDELLYDIEDLEEQLGQQKDTVMQYMKLLYQHESQFYDFSTGKLHDFKLLLSDEKMAEIYRSERYLSLVQQSIRGLITDYEQILLELEWNKEVLFTKQNSLRKLEATLVKEERQLDQQIEGKAFLLKTTLGQEAKYQVLIKEMRQQEEDSIKDIENLQNALLALRDDVTGIKRSAAEAVLSNEELRNRALAVYKLGDAEAEDIIGVFSWPVEPVRGISAYFRDASYVKVFGVGHNAIDVPTAQSTPILAPADAYVYKVKDNGYGYSYIILAHRGDFLTLYGHVSKILVTPGELVERGEVIGLSGGAPGTLGAGWMTTGAHLHFEVFKNGKHVNPLDYLDPSKIKASWKPATVANPLRNPIPTNPLPQPTTEPSGDDGKVKRVE